MNIASGILIIAAALPCLVYPATAQNTRPKIATGIGETCICPLIKKNVCASDGNTYSECILNCLNRRRVKFGLKPLTIQYPGACINCVCPANVDPVCGSDGNTYSNYCLFLCENNKRKCLGVPQLTLRWKGSCNCGCSREWKPVCASDRQTWPNKCLLRCENKKRALFGLPPITVLGAGICKPCHCSKCPNKYKPVCGNNRVTYWNDCYLLCNSSCRVSVGFSPIKKIADKAC